MNALSELNEIAASNFSEKRIRLDQDFVLVTVAFFSVDNYIGQDLVEFGVYDAQRVVTLLLEANDQLVTRLPEPSKRPIHSHQ